MRDRTSVTGETFAWVRPASGEFLRVVNANHGGVQFIIFWVDRVEVTDRLTVGVEESRLVLQPE